MNKTHPCASLVAGILASVVLANPAHAADRYYNFSAVSSKCTQGPDNQFSSSETGDYHIDWLDKASPVTALAIHGGKIEKYTSEIVKRLSDELGYNLYSFNAHPKRNDCAGTLDNATGRWELHATEMRVTATHFDDPRAEGLVSRYPYAFSVYGYTDAWDDAVCVGGADDHAVRAFISYFNAHQDTYANTRPIFAVDARGVSTGKCSKIGGTSADNIVNKTNTNAGLQLELSLTFRKGYAEDAEGFRWLLKQAVKSAFKRDTPNPPTDTMVCTGGLGHEVTNTKETSCGPASEEVWIYSTKQWGKPIDAGRTYFPCAGNTNEGYSQSEDGTRYKTVRAGNQTTMYLNDWPVLSLTCQ